MPLVTRSIAAALLTAACLVPAASAQDRTQDRSPPPAATEPAPDLSDQKLDKAAAALNQVANVKNDYQQKIESAPDTDKERILNEANGALVKAVTDNGLTVEEYNSILVVAQADPAVREKIFQRLRPAPNPADAPK
jgi:uncharacterized protein YlxW (UPF0749 family)